MSQENSAKIPDNWAFFNLTEICQQERNSIKRGPFGSAIKKEFFVPSGFKVYEQKNAIYNDFTLGNYYINSEKFEELKNFEVKPNDIIMSCSGTVGKLAVVPEDSEKGVINQALLKLTVNNEVVDTNYFLLMFQSKIDQILLNNLHGSAMKNIASVRELKKFLFPIPPINEQKRILYKIEEFFTKLDAGIQELTLAKEKLKIYRQSVLKHAFEGKLTEEWREAHKDEIESSEEILNKIKTKKEPIKVRRGVPKTVEMPEILQNFGIPDSWDFISVADLLRNGALIDIKDGNHGSNHPKRDEFTEDGLPFITAAQVHKFKVDYNGAPKIKGEPLEKLNVGFSHPGDVILTHKGSVGRVGICTEECVLTPQTTYYRFEKDAFNDKYLAYALSSPIFQLQLSKIKSQTTRDFVSITKQYNLFIPFLSLLEQKEIVKEMDERFSSIDEIEKIIEMNLSKSQKLRQSILKKAFSGQLFPQDPNDEPAQQLLERIKSEKAKQKPQSKSRRSKQKRLVK